MLVHSLFTYFVWHSRHHHELISHCVDVINVKLRDPSVQTGVEQIHKVDQLEFKTFHRILSLDRSSCIVNEDRRDGIGFQSSLFITCSYEILVGSEMFLQ